jgi:FlaA1/EpsC-like NDP-sugar epimerase
MNIHPQLKNPKFYFIILADAFLFAAALLLAYGFRFEFLIAPFWMRQLQGLLWWIVPLKFALFLVSGLYRGMWRYTSVRDFWLLARVSLLATLMIISMVAYFYRFEGYSRAVFILDGLLTFLLTGGLRMAIRSYYSRKATSRDAVGFVNKDHWKKILIVGAGDAGEKILREIRDNYYLLYKIEGFIDDDPAKQGRTIHGVKVLGPVNKMPKIIERKSIKEVLIAIPSATGEQMRTIVDTCQHCEIPYKVLPGIGEIIDGRVSVKMLRDINYEDLLRRSPVHLDVEKINRYLEGKTILITGGGGSIGSELCRQIMKFNPRLLLLLDASELNLFNMQMEIGHAAGACHCETILGNVQDAPLMEEIFKKFAPQVVFHAAAFKHVPMQERNPWEAVYNNIIGTQVSVDAAIKHRAECFILISTDKAVRPTNVMGATKRVAELVVQSRQNLTTRCIAVRFGNVVGSSGSVVPTFLRQIEKGGPVTVTHPEVSRFFMTVSEASQLILQAAALGAGGEIFVLKMGTPVRIADMARDLISLTGKKPDVDISIAYVGLREGEKLYEELITEGEDVLPTRHEKIMVLRAQSRNDCSEYRTRLDKDIEALLSDSRRHDAQAIKTKLQEIVGDYTPQDHRTVF